MCILFVYTLLKVVSCYDLSVLSMSVMGFQKKFGWGWVGGVQVFFYVWNCLTLQSSLGAIGIVFPTCEQTNIFKKCLWKMQHYRAIHLHQRTPLRCLHSSSRILLNVSRINLEHFRLRAFASASPILLNNLPAKLRVKRQPHTIQEVFNCISANAPIKLLASEMPASRSGRCSRPLPVTLISIGCYWLSAKKIQPIR